MKVYIIDNYDSFTYNLYQYIGEVLTSEKNHGSITDFDICVKRNDEISLDDVRQAKPDRIIISPGPGSPDSEKYFGICAQVIKELGTSIPVLGVCLGMQGIVHAFGGNVIKAHVPMHGKISAITHNGQGVFADTPDQLEVMRYHSLMADATSFPDCLAVTALVGDIPAEDFNNLEIIRAGGEFEIMGIQHKQHPIYGIQFHPESFATEGGKELIKNFLFCG